MIEKPVCRCDRCGAVCDKLYQISYSRVELCIKRGGFGNEVSWSKQPFLIESHEVCPTCFDAFTEWLLRFSVDKKEKETKA